MTTTHFPKSQSSLSEAAKNEREREKAKTVLAFATDRKRSSGRFGSFCQFPFRRTPFLFIPLSFFFSLLSLSYPPTRRPAGFQLSFPMETRTAAPDHSTVPKHLKTFNRKQRWDSILARASTSDDEDNHVRRENVWKMYELRVQLYNFQLARMKRVRISRELSLRIANDMERKERGLSFPR